MLTVLAVIIGTAYVARRTLLLDLARVALNHDSTLVAQERADAVRIEFTTPPHAWVSPMKNQMNDIWRPIHAAGVNYYTFAGPRNWLQSYSERSNPRSPYYQAWVGGYVIKRSDRSLPQDLQSWAWQVTRLDQHSWLSAMGDPSPRADASEATRIGNITIDGQLRPLWHGTMQSHSDLNDNPTGPLATLVGMPPRSSWPAGLTSFHDVQLNGYFVCWTDSTSNVSVVIYAVAANYAGQPAVTRNDHTRIHAELMGLMKSARLLRVN